MSQWHMGAVNVGPFVGVDLNLWQTVYIAIIVCWQGRNSNTCFVLSFAILNTRWRNWLELTVIYLLSKSESCTEHNSCLLCSTGDQPAALTVIGPRPLLTSIRYQFINCCISAGNIWWKLSWLNCYKIFHTTSQLSINYTWMSELFNIPVPDITVSLTTPKEM